MNSNFKAMKKLMLVLIGAAVLFQCQARNASEAYGDTQKTPAAKGSITLSSTSDLQQLTARWISGFTEKNPQVKVRVAVQNEPASDLAFISDENANAEKSEAKWKMVVGRDALIPVINSANPNLTEINSRGVSAPEFAKLFDNQGTKTWGMLLEGTQEQPVNVYLLNNESVRATIAEFSALDKSAISGKTFETSAEMLAALQKDPNGIAFCKITDITNPDGQNVVSGISLLPIDKNANGRMDYIEKIYANVNDLSRGIWIGKYPESLCRNIYAVASAKPVDDNQVAFLRYVLTDGQDILQLAGYNSLVNSERLSKIDRLAGALLKAPAEKVNVLQLIITILAGIAIVFALVFFIVKYRRSNIPLGPEAGPKNLRSFNPRTLNVPKGLFFDKTHTWAFMEKDGTLKVGIDDFLQHITGHISSMIMKKPGEQVKKGDPILTIVQKGKRLTISSPASGIIIAENTNLLSDPSLINASPYEDGWIYRIEPTNWIRENQFLFMAEKYTEWIKNEFARLKDFLATAVKADAPEYAYAILQDGGEVADRVLENLPPEIWEDFQTKFIDISK